MTRTTSPNLQFVRRARVKIPVEKKVLTADGRGWKLATAGTAEAFVELWVDIDTVLLRLGARALRSRGKRTRALAGDLVVKVVGKITREEVAP